jgi:hypothetical protein
MAVAKQYVYKYADGSFMEEGDKPVTDLAEATILNATFDMREVLTTAKVEGISWATLKGIAENKTEILVILNAM